MGSALKSKELVPSYNDAQMFPRSLAVVISMISTGSWLSGCKSSSGQPEGSLRRLADPVIQDNVNSVCEYIETKVFGIVT
jgi:hypothetical protein